MRVLTTWAVAIALSAVGASACAQTSPSSISLLWTATGDDGDVGQAYRYDLRYSTSNVIGTDTLSWWTASGTRSASNLPAPSPSGQTESATVTGLASETTYNFIVRVLDEVGNQSPFSNIATGTTAPEIPPAPPGCSAPAATPSQFQAAEDSGEVVVSWAQTSDPLATELHLWRATGLTQAVSLLATITDPNQTTFQDTSVNAGTTYRYRATWAAACGDGPATGSVLVSMAPAPPGPPGAAAEGALHAYPNPSNGAVQFVIRVDATSAASARIRLYDLSGHVVAEIADGVYPPGDTTLTWPRTNPNGERVAPGYYEAIGVVGGAKVRERLVLLP